MRRQVRNLTHCLLCVSILTFVCRSIVAAQPAETLLPATTKGFVSIPSIEELSSKWDRTQFGQLLLDPVMKPFVQDFQNQVHEKLSQTGLRLGINWDDLDGVTSGEVAVATIQPDGDKTKHAMALIADITGREMAASALLDKLAKNVIKGGGSRSVKIVGGAEMVVFSIPDKDRKRSHQAYYFQRDGLLAASDHEGTAQLIWSNFGAKESKTLGKLASFQSALKSCSTAAGEIGPQIRWYIDPFGYMEVSRAMNLSAGGKKKRGTDNLKILANQGFKAIQGIGGQLSFATGRHEVMHFTKIYAPSTSTTKNEKYQLAARMLSFPNNQNLLPQNWIPQDLACYLTLNWKMKDAFWYSKTIVDELADAEIFDDILHEFEKDPSGPGVNVDREIIQQLGERFTLMTDYRLPITTKSERYLIAIEIKNPAIVAKAVEKFMSVEKNAKKVVIDGQTVWEVSNEEELLEFEAISIVNVDGKPAHREEDEEEDEDKPLIPNSAIAVVNGHLIIASHIDYVTELLQKKERTTLSQANDFQAVSATLQELGCGDDSFRFFVRSDESYRTTYELMRQGKMPESESLLGKLLNKFLAPAEKGVKREQQIDASKLPEFDAVRRYLGPGGFYVRTEDDGWFVGGCILNKHN